MKLKLTSWKRTGAHAPLSFPISLSWPISHFPNIGSYWNKVPGERCIRRDIEWLLLRLKGPFFIVSKPGQRERIRYMFLPIL